MSTKDLGLIVRKIKRQTNICTICESQLVDENNESISLLLKIKNKDRLINPSADVQKICLATEHIAPYAKMHTCGYVGHRAKKPCPITLLTTVSNNFRLSYLDSLSSFGQVLITLVKC
ncbi:THAP-type domain-containing protein [Aphis craccivora]|uniref:THAP-type domain-containing protein n=1 Tax=Aphis craccivora TaxID=307492 RepID=A0A6G0YGY5_APHCR|nr:THAP-type domain-containing protein [Aphis craccivora]